MHFLDIKGVCEDKQMQDQTITMEMKFEIKVEDIKEYSASDLVINKEELLLLDGNTTLIIINKKIIYVLSRY